MIIGMIGNTFTAAQTRITRPGGVIIDASNLVDGFRVVDAPDETDEPGVREWAAGMWLDVEDQVTHSGVTYQVRQRHFTQSDWLPSVVLALYTVVNTEPPVDDVLPWIAGETVVAGDLRSYEGVTYSCIQGHTTQTGWHPPAVPALWGVVA